MNRTAPLRSMLLVVATCATALGCGVPIDRDATATDPEAVPYELLDSTTTTIVSGNPAGGETNICLTIDSTVLAVGRDRGGDPPLDSLLALVSAGPTEGESRLGLRSALTGDDPIVEVQRSGDAAVVELGTDFADLPADQQLLAVAQITCTLTTQPGVQQVSFELNGTQIEVPVQGGSLVARAVTRADYDRLIAN